MKGLLRVSVLIFLNYTKWPKKRDYLPENLASIMAKHTGVSAHHREREKALSPSTDNLGITDVKDGN